MLKSIFYILFYHIIFSSIILCYYIMLDLGKERYLHGVAFLALRLRRWLPGCVLGRVDTVVWHASSVL